MPEGRYYGLLGLLKGYQGNNEAGMGMDITKMLPCLDMAGDDDTSGDPGLSLWYTDLGMGRSRRYGFSTRGVLHWRWLCVPHNTNILLAMHE